MYYTCDHPAKFLPEVTEALTAFENRLIAEEEAVTATAETLFKARKQELALDYLTRYSEQAGKDAMRLGHALLGSIEARTELLYGLRRPQGSTTSELNYEAITCRSAAP
jgi:hypothetical protein